MNITTIVVYSLIGLIIAADIFLIQYLGKPGSISAWFITESQKHPMIAFGSGFVMGHFFWRMKEKDLPKPSIDGDKE